MQQYEQRQSGLITPVQPPQEPPRQYGPLELQDKVDREATKLALAQLWRAAGMDRGMGIVFPGHSPGQSEARRKLWKILGEMLLGDDCQSCEIKA